MSSPLPDIQREVIPRWRDLRSTIALGEHGPKQSNEPRGAPPSEFLEKLRDWESERSLPFASEVVGAAIVFAAYPEAQEAAQFVLDKGDQASSQAVELARRVLNRGSVATARRALDRESIQKSIKALKVEVRSDPRDAFGWAAMARDYAILGQLQKSVQSMDCALALAPNNRYVLRSAARLHTHLGDHARAHAILVAADATREDPWLIAAEIGTARLAGRNPRFIGTARRISESRSFSDEDKAELTSALATQEAASGDLKRARKLFRSSLVAPNDNTVAQARWASSKGIFDLDPNLLDLRTAYEARAWYAFYEGEWEKSRKAGKNWLRDQPFAASPAIHASYVAAVALGNHADAVSTLRAALIANPSNGTLLNNLAYSLANLGQLDEAETQLKRAEKSAGVLEKPLVLATEGLLAYRQQHFEIGSALYEEAIKAALSSSNRMLAAKATLFFAFESLRALQPNALDIARRAMSQSSEWRNADFGMLRQRLKEATEHYIRVRGESR